MAAFLLFILALAKLPTALSEVELLIATSSNHKIEGSCYTNEEMFEKRKNAHAALANVPAYICKCMCW